MGADLTGVVWHESRHCSTAECVEAEADRPADDSPAQEPMAVGQGAAAPRRPAPYYTPIEWDAFRRGIQTGDFMVRTN